MSSKQKVPQNEEEDEDEEELDLNQKQNPDQDDDFDFKDKEDASQAKKDEKALKVQNNHFDEAFNLSDNGSDEYNSGEENQDKEKNSDAMKSEQKRPAVNAKAESLQRKADESDDENKKNIKIEGLYDPADYASLNVSTEIKELFKYITRYKPIHVEIETKLKAFIPDYIPAVGEVDAFLKMPRPDNQPEQLGLSILDEPTLNQSKKAKLDLIFNEVMKRNREGKSLNIHSIEGAEKNPKEISAWINDVAEIHKKKQLPTVSYSKAMPDIDALMQVWPVEIEEAFGELAVPTEDIDLSLGEYAKLACSILDIPVHNLNNNKNIIESLHVFFTLFSEFKANQHFQQQAKADGYDDQVDIN